MAAGTTHKALPDLVKAQLVLAEKKFAAFEEEAQKFSRELIQRVKESRKEIRGMLERAAEFEIGERAEELKGRAEKTGAEVVKRLETLQDRALSLVGVASQAQVDDLAHELDRLAKKIERFGRKAGRPSGRKTGTGRTHPPTSGM